MTALDGEDEDVTVRIVAMTPAHIPLIEPFEEEMFGAEAWSADSYAAELADRRHRFYIAALADPPQPDLPILGWAGLMTIGHTAQILTIGVVPAAQRHGIGQTMLDALLQEARRRNAEEVLLEVRTDNRAARRLYERNRFTALRVRRGYYDLGRADAVEMRREL